MGRVALAMLRPGPLFLVSIAPGGKALNELDGDARGFIVLGIEQLRDGTVRPVGGLVRVGGIVALGAQFLDEVFAFLAAFGRVGVGVDAKDRWR